MLYSPPPGYNSSTENRQTMSGLGTPGSQSTPTTPGASNSLLGGYYKQPQFIQYQNQTGSGLNPGINNTSVTGNSPGTSNLSISGSSNPNNTVDMNQYNNSPNLSTLIRTLVGKTT